MGLVFLLYEFGMLVRVLVVLAGLELYLSEWFPYI